MSFYAIYRSPFCFAAIPSYLFPGIERFNFRDDSLYRVFRGEYGVEITHARRTLQAVLSDAKISAHLEIPLGTPLILFTCSTFGRVHGSERIIEHFHCHYRTDKHQFYIDQVRR